MLNQKKWWVATVVFVALLAALLLGLLLVVKRTDQPGQLETGLATVISGVPACLPPAGDLQLPVCVIGLKNDQGRYFELKDPTNGYRQIEQLQLGQHVSVYGLLTNIATAGYQADGTLTIINKY